MISINPDNINLQFSDRLNEIKSREYKLELRRETTCLYCHKLREWILPENFNVDESYYFEDVDNPDEDRMLYAISLNVNVKGFLIDSCNAYSDNISAAMRQKLRIGTEPFQQHLLPNGNAKKGPLETISQPI